MIGFSKAWLGVIQKSVSLLNFVASSSVLLRLTRFLVAYQGLNSLYSWNKGLNS
jgi:hypothetical protein